MNIGPKKPDESVVVSLSENGERTIPGSELVTFNRDTDISSLTICATKMILY